MTKLLEILSLRHSPLVNELKLLCLPWQSTLGGDRRGCDQPFRPFSPFYDPRPGLWWPIAFPIDPFI